ncbi:hypothetical protein GCM10027075_25010 [Streptomyces heilongjiangensis]
MLDVSEQAIDLNLFDAPHGPSIQLAVLWNTGNGRRLSLSVVAHYELGEVGGHQKTRASQPDGSGTAVTGPPSQLALVNDSGSVAEAGGGAARHTRAWSAGAPAVVADCRRLSFVPLSCQMQRSATVNEVV